MVDVVRRDKVSYESATAMVTAAIAEARKTGFTISVVVTDPAGGLIAVGRMDGAHEGTAEYARKKAYFSGRSGKHTEDYVHDRLTQDEIIWRALSSDSDLFLTPGGVPIVVDGTTVGGVGVSGAPYATDAALERAAVDGASYK